MQHISVFDVDSPAADVLLEALSDGSARLCTRDGETTIERFTLADLLNGKIYAELTGASGGGDAGTITLSARSPRSAAMSTPIATTTTTTTTAAAAAAAATRVTLRLVGEPVRLFVETNRGLRLAHRAAAFITPAELSVRSHLHNVRVRYAIVEASFTSR